MDVPASDPQVQLKLMIGELVITIAQLEAQKAALLQQLAAVTTPAEPSA